MKICPRCDNTHNKNGIYCSQSCANKRGKNLSLVCKCGEKFNFPSYSKRKFCSQKCSQLYNNKPSGGYRQGSGRAKTGYFRGIYCGSTYELVWVIYNLDNEILFSRFEGSLEKDGIRYYPDFVIGNIIYEIKGYEKQESVDKKTKVAESFGYDVIVLRKENLQKEFDWVRQNYTYKELFELYDGYKPKFILNCSCCGSEVSRNSKPKTEVIFCTRVCAGKGHKGIGNKLAKKNQHTKDRSSNGQEIRLSIGE